MSALQIAQRWYDLKRPANTPLAIFTTDGTVDGKVAYIREANINHALRQKARAVYNISKEEELGCATSHSIRVGACVALHDANVSKTNIKHALRWNSNCFMTYLQNLPRQAQHTARAVLDFHPDRLDIVPGAVATA